MAEFQGSTSILEKLAAEADGESLPEHFVEVQPDDIDDLISLLYRPARRLPVILVSTDDNGGAQIDLKSDFGHCPPPVFGHGRKL
jgi:hypothetical protein